MIIKLVLYKFVSFIATIEYFVMGKLLNTVYRTLRDKVQGNFFHICIRFCIYIYIEEVYELICT